MNISGLGVAVITPFDDNHQVDVQALKKIIDHLINGNTSYLVLLGTTSEAATLTADEKDLVIKTALSVNKGRIPVVMGIGGNNTSAIVASLKNTNFEKIDAILSVCPYYNKPNQAGIYAHFKEIANNSPLPVILYNVPGRTSANMNAGTTLQLACDFKNIIGIKEASGNFEQIMQIVQNKPEGFQVVSGDDALTLPLLATGLDGVISVIGNAFPAEFSQMISEFKQGNIQQARELHYNMLEFIHTIFAEGNPVGIKMLMHLLGFGTPIVRLPLVKLSPANTEKLRSLLANK